MKYTVIQKCQKSLTIKQQPLGIIYHYVNISTIPLHTKVILQPLLITFLMKLKRSYYNMIPSNYFTVVFTENIYKAVLTTLFKLFWICIFFLILGWSFVKVLIAIHFQL